MYPSKKRFQKTVRQCPPLYGKIKQDGIQSTHIKDPSLRMETQGLITSVLRSLAKNMIWRKDLGSRLFDLTADIALFVRDSFRAAIENIQKLFSSIADSFTRTMHALGVLCVKLYEYSKKKMSSVCVFLKSLVSCAPNIALDDEHMKSVELLFSYTSSSEESDVIDVSFLRDTPAPQFQTDNSKSYEAFDAHAGDGDSEDPTVFTRFFSYIISIVTSFAGFCELFTTSLVGASATFLKCAAVINGMNAVSRFDPVKRTKIIVNWLYSWFSDKPPFADVHNRQRFVACQEELISMLAVVDGYSNPPLELLYRMNKLRNEMGQCYDKLLIDYPSDHAWARTVYDSVVTQCKKYTGQVLSQQARIAPVSVWFSGKSATGKTTAQKQLIKDIDHYFSDILRDNDNFDPETKILLASHAAKPSTYTRNCATSKPEYDDGYNNARFAIFEECQTPKDEKINVEWMRVLMQWVDTEPLMCNMAYSKAEVYVDSPFVFVTGNKTDSIQTGIEDPSAFYRRMDFFFEVTNSGPSHKSFDFGLTRFKLIESSRKVLSNLRLARNTSFDIYNATYPESKITMNSELTYEQVLVLVLITYMQRISKEYAQRTAASTWSFKRHDISRLATAKYAFTNRAFYRHRDDKFPPSDFEGKDKDFSSGEESDVSVMINDDGLIMPELGNEFSNLLEVQGLTDYKRISHTPSFDKRHHLRPVLDSLLNTVGDKHVGLDHVSISIKVEGIVAGMRSAGFKQSQSYVPVLKGDIYSLYIEWYEMAIRLTAKWSAEKATIYAPGSSQEFRIGSRYGNPVVYLYHTGLTITHHISTSKRKLSYLEEQPAGPTYLRRAYVGTQRYARERMQQAWPYDKWGPIGPGVEKEKRRIDIIEKHVAWLARRRARNAKRQARQREAKRAKIAAAKRAMLDNSKSSCGSRVVKGRSPALDFDCEYDIPLDDNWADYDDEFTEDDYKSYAEFLRNTSDDPFETQAYVGMTSTACGSGDYAHLKTAISSMDDYTPTRTYYSRLTKAIGAHECEILCALKDEDPVIRHNAFAAYCARYLTGAAYQRLFATPFAKRGHWMSELATHAAFYMEKHGAYKETATTLGRHNLAPILRFCQVVVYAYTQAGCISDYYSDASHYALCHLLYTFGAIKFSKEERDGGDIVPDDLICKTGVTKTSVSHTIFFAVHFMQLGEESDVRFKTSYLARVADLLDEKVTNKPSLRDALVVTAVCTAVACLVGLVVAYATRDESDVDSIIESIRHQPERLQQKIFRKFSLESFDPKTAPQKPDPRAHAAARLFENQGVEVDRVMDKFRSNAYAVISDDGTKVMANCLFVRGNVMFMNYHVWHTLEHEVKLLPFMRGSSIRKCLKFRKADVNTYHVLHQDEAHDLIVVQVLSAMAHHNLLKFMLPTSNLFKPLGPSQILSFNRETATPFVDPVSDVCWDKSPREYDWRNELVIPESLVYTWCNSQKGACFSMLFVTINNITYWSGFHIAGNRNKVGISSIVHSDAFSWLKDDNDPRYQRMASSGGHISLSADDKFDVQCYTTVNSTYVETMHTNALGTTVLVATPFTTHKFRGGPTTAPADCSRQGYVNGMAKEFQINQDTSYPADDVYRIASTYKDAIIDIIIPPNVVHASGLTSANYHTAALTNDTVDRPDHSTSEGIRLKKYGIKKASLSDENHPNHAKIEGACLKWRSTCVADDEYSYQLNVDHLKDEPRPIEKVSFPRPFNITDYMDNILLRMSMCFLVASMKHYHMFTSAMCGINPASSVWMVVMRQFENLPVCATDIKGWDYTMKRWLTIVVCRLFQRVFPDKYDFDFACWAFISCLYGVRCNAGRGRIPGGGNTSGNWCTTFFNTMCNHIYHCVVLIYGCELNGIDPLVQLGHLRLVLYSDDNISSLPGQLWWNHQFLTHAFKDLLGITLTATDKSDAASMKPHYLITEVEFLCRRFERRNGIAYAPLNIESLYQQLYWVRVPGKMYTSQALYSQLQINLDNVVRELCEYPPEEAAQMIAEIRRFVAAYKVPVQVKSLDYSDVVGLKLSYY